jgi:four helix bundle protein
MGRKRIEDRFMAEIKSFRDLIVYQAARSEGLRIFKITKKFPSEETYSLIDQIRRSSRAVNAMIAEGWARRRYKAVFINKINEAMETQAWLDRALACEYLSDTEFKSLDTKWQEIGAMLNGMIGKADSFCKDFSK